VFSFIVVISLTDHKQDMEARFTTTGEGYVSKRNIFLIAPISQVSRHLFLNPVKLLNREQFTGSLLNSFRYIAYRLDINLLN